MVPVLAKAPCDVLTVARSWDDLPVQGIYLRDVAEVSSLWDVFVFGIKFVWDVSCVSRLRDDRECRIAVGCRACSA